MLNFPTASCIFCKYLRPRVGKFVKNQNHHRKESRALLLFPDKNLESLPTVSSPCSGSRSASVRGDLGNASLYSDLRFIRAQQIFVSQAISRQVDSHREIKRDVLLRLFKFVGRIFSTLLICNDHSAIRRCARIAFNCAYQITVSYKQK